MAGLAMTRDDIIRMAREAGLERYHLPDSMMEYEFDRCIERFAALVAAAEREACAKVCDELIADTPDNDPDSDAIGACAIAIRARSNP